MTDRQPAARGVDRRSLIATGMGGAAAFGLLAAASPAAAGAVNAEFYEYGPTRLADSRSGLRTAKSKIRRGQTRTISAQDFFVTGTPLTLLLHISLLQTEGRGSFTVWQSGVPRPGVFSTSWGGPGQGNTTLVPTGLRVSDVSFDLYCGGISTAAAHFTVDLVGYFFHTP